MHAVRYATPTQTNIGVRITNAYIVESGYILADYHLAVFRLLTIFNNRNHIHAVGQT